MHQSWFKVSAVVNINIATVILTQLHLPLFYSSGNIPGECGYPFVAHFGCPVLTLALAFLVYLSAE